MKDLNELPEEFQELFYSAKGYKDQLDRKDATETSESDEILGLTAPSEEDLNEEVNCLNSYLDNDVEMDEDEVDLNWISAKMRETL